MNINKKNLTIGVLGAALLATSGIAAADAAQGEEHQKRGHRHNPEIHEIVETPDYESWSQYENLPDKLAGFDEAQFNQFADMHELRQAGDKEGAEEIRELLGLPERGEQHHEDDREEMREAILEGDFEEWAEELAERGVDAGILTQDNFNTIKTAVESGDKEAIKAAHQELGIGPKHKGPHNGERAGKILELSYEEWAEKASERGLDAEKVNESTFNTLQQAAELFQSGDKEGAKALLEEAGVKPPHESRGHRFGGDREDGERGERGPHGQR